MTTSDDSPSILVHKRTLAVYAILFGSALLTSVLFGTGRLSAGAALCVGGCASAILIARKTSIDVVLIGWFLTSPLASFYFRFPREQSILTFDRAVIGGAALSIILTLSISKKNKESHSLKVSPFELLWAGLVIVVLVNTLLLSQNFPFAFRMAIDSIGLPLLAFYLARRHVDLRQHRVILVLGLCALSFFLFATGAYELIRGNNLFPWSGSELIRAGERRVNGPFSSDAAYVSISVLLFLFLQAAPRVLEIRFAKGTRIIYNAALVAAFVASLLPLFRAAAFALVFSSLILELLVYSFRRFRTKTSSITPKKRTPYEVTTRRTKAILVSSLAAAGAFAIIALAYNRAYVDRLGDPANAFSRVATWEYGSQMAIERPLFGVGLANYSDYFRQKFRGRLQPVLGARPMNSPHSNLIWIWTELGIVGLILAGLAYFNLLGSGVLKLVEASNLASRTAAACFLAMIGAYSIIGLTLTNAHYSDLNLFFFFSLGLLLSIARREPIEPIASA